MNVLTRVALILSVTAASTPLYAETAAERLAESATILKEVMDAPDKGIPSDLLRSAQEGGADRGW